MDVKIFLDHLVKNRSEYELTAEDEKLIRHEGIREFIFRKLASSKYRAQDLGEDFAKKIKDKIDLCVNHEIPIHTTLPFGATKNPYLPTAPGVDWAEVFNLAYIREYLAPIARAYERGVILEYISVAVFEEKVNHIPQKDSDLYDREFRQLVTFFQKYLPKNFKLEFSRVTDTIPREVAERQLDLKMAALAKTWADQSAEVQERKLFRAKRNCLVTAKDKDVDKVLLWSALGHDAFCSECWTTEAAPWDKKTMITLGHNYTTGWAIHVRSARGSSVNFWSGSGVLEHRGGEFIPTVLSPNQYKELESKIKTEKVNLFPKGFKNLSTVPILATKL